MEIEKIIERLKQKDGLWCSVPTGERLISDASTTLEQLQAENDRLKRERDAAVRDLKLCAGFDDLLCHFCKTDSEECSSCISGTRWQWRGPQEE